MVLCLGPAVVRAQSDDVKLLPAPVPRLKAAAHRLEDFTPPQWSILSKAAGDLNGDGLPDIAFVMRGTNKALRLPKSDTYPEGQDTNPFILGVAFAQAEGGFRLIAQNNMLLPRYQEEPGDDEFGEGGTLEIKRGVLSIEFAAMLMSMNDLQKYIFRYQHDRMELIGYESDQIERALQRDTQQTVNYSTGMKTLTETMPGEKDKFERKRLRNMPPLPLEKVGSASDFNYF